MRMAFCVSVLAVCLLTIPAGLSAGFQGLKPPSSDDCLACHIDRIDYWAVLWGTVIMGAAGLVLWFPETASRLLPGWMFNVALFVHGAEATLAIGFIFVVHFFSGHLRPEKFPMDLVIFTGAISESDLLRERAAQYERLAVSGELERLSVPPPSTLLRKRGYIVGSIGLSLGITLFGLILYAVLS